MLGVTTTREEHKAFVALQCFTGAEISQVFFPSDFPLSLLKSPTDSGGHQTPQRPARAAQSPKCSPWGSQTALPTGLGASRLPGEQMCVAGLRFWHFSPREAGQVFVHT